MLLKYPPVSPRIPPNHETRDMPFLELHHQKADPLSRNVVDYLWLPYIWFNWIHLENGES